MVKSKRAYVAVDSRLRVERRGYISKEKGSLRM